MHNDVNVLDAIETYVAKWLKWSVLCYIYKLPEK